MTDSLSLWEFCDTLGELPGEQTLLPFDPDDMLTHLNELHENEDSLLPVDVQSTYDVEASPQSKVQDDVSLDKDSIFELSKYRESSMSSSNSEILTISPVALSPALPLPVFTTTLSPALPLPVFTAGTTSAIVSGGLIAALPPMFKTKLDCPRDGGCFINTVKSLPGGSSCKGRDAIGSKHKFSCLCGLKWQENNWRERERLTSLGEEDTRCIQYLPTTSTPKRKQSDTARKQSDTALPKAKK